MDTDHSPQQGHDDMATEHIEMAADMGNVQPMTTRLSAINREQSPR